MGLGDGLLVGWGQREDGKGGKERLRSRKQGRQALPLLLLPTALIPRALGPQGALAPTRAKPPVLPRRLPNCPPHPPYWSPGQRQPHSLGPVCRAAEGTAGQRRVWSCALLQPRPQSEQPCPAPVQGLLELWEWSCMWAVGQRPPGHSLPTHSPTGEPLPQEQGPGPPAHRPAPLQAGARTPVPGHACCAPGGGEPRGRGWGGHLPRLPPPAAGEWLSLLGSGGLACFPPDNSCSWSRSLPGPPGSQVVCG